MSNEITKINSILQLLHGDVVAMTDQNREAVATYEYDAWGNVLKSDTKGIAADNPFGYAGYMYDKEIGMYYLIARYYNPDHGVFLSVDPDPGDEDDPVTMNGYTYGDNNPVMMVDPDGHKAWKKKAKRIWYATKAGAKAGGKAWVDSYLSIGKGLALGAGYFYGYATGKQNYINKNKPVYNKAYVNKAARKAGLKVGLKAFWGFGLIEDAYVFGSAAYKGYKKAYKNYR
ncbi:RHS repeat-associated core domain-containing protein [Bacillus thuringiensis]|uniref:RHS repeat-associated core domain-containing protein n=1 Tax=Bacillus thuringiensis TaxID=1428 RepID=UPI001FABA3EE|nr:RHS repeat-associated core domain-containing protein [Bacillus thuringiensis]MDM8364101.1 RHS repeat-associated core domain-containing protein [Bacillus thuringiensis]